MLQEYMKRIFVCQLDLSGILIFITKCEVLMIFVLVSGNVMFGQTEEVFDRVNIALFVFKYAVI